MIDLLGTMGFLGLLTGLILFITSVFTEIPKKLGVNVAFIGFVFINLSDFPKGSLYGVFSFFAIVVGFLMLVVCLAREKPVKNSIIVIVIGFISFLGIVSTSTETPNDTEETTVESGEAQEKVAEPEEEVVSEEIIEEKEEVIVEATDEKEEPVENIIGIGDVIVIDDVHYVINEVTSANNVGGEYGKEAISQFTIVNLTVQNEQNEAIKVDSDQFQLVSGERTYEASGSAGIYANKDYDFFYTEINPGVALTGNIVFDVPANLKNLELHIQNDLWGNKTGIVYLQ